VQCCVLLLGQEVGDSMAYSSIRSYSKLSPVEIINPAIRSSFVYPGQEQNLRNFLRFLDVFPCIHISYSSAFELVLSSLS